MLGLNLRILRSFFYALCFVPLVSYAQSSVNQFSCGASVSTNDIFNLNEELKQATNSKQTRAAIKQYRVSVRATVFHESSLAEKKLTSADVRSLINHANIYLANINVELFLQNDNVQHVSDNEYVNFKVDQEAALRTKYDVANAVNLYFFKTISTEEDVFLNGSAALPNLSKNSNRIFLSYLDRNKEDFETLKNKVFLHELGHYFGLLHTFQSSNDADVSKRELVSRDIGTIGNCNSTGDYLCDTPADPFERLVTISSYNCNEQLPPNLVDAFGYPYSPPTDNIMSYHVRCGNVFTRGQYQRMEQSFAIRFSPNASYNILGNQANYLIVSSISSNEFCEGEEMKVKFSAFGDFGRNDNFVLQLSDSSGENFFDVPQAVLTGGNQFTFRLDNIKEQSPNYRVRVVSKVPYLESTVSEQFTIHTKGELSLSLADSLIRPGGSSTLFLNLTGSGPWEVVFDNGITLSSVNSRSHRIKLKPLSTNLYKVASVTGKCGAVVIKNSVTLSIAEPAIIVKPEFEKKSCQETFFQIPVTGLKSFVGTSPYTIKLTNPDTTITLSTSAGTSSIFAMAPKFIKNGINTYELTIEGPSFEDYSEPTLFRIFPKSAPPTTNSSVSYCFNSVAQPLVAFGDKLKWYYGQNDLKVQTQIIPSTTQPGVYYYYVTQTNNFGCESDRQEVKVIIKPPATAEISGDKTIKFGDKTSVSIKLNGDAPWNFQLSDGRQFQSFDSELFPEVQPSQTKIYTLKSALNNCGNIFLTGSARIVVLQPLSLKNEILEDIQVYPNPVSEEFLLTINDAGFKQNGVSLKLFDMLGRPVISQKVAIKEAQAPIAINVRNLPPGVYQLRLSNDKQLFTKRVSVKR